MCTAAVGRRRTAQVDKHKLVQALRVRHRDILTLDPTVPIPWPAAILVRERALVVNLETVRMLICANQCFVLSGAAVWGWGGWGVGGGGGGTGLA